MASQCRGGAAHRGLSLASALADLTMRRRDRALWYPAAKTLARFDPAVAASWAQGWQHECGASTPRRGVHSLIAVHELVWPKKTCISFGAFGDTAPLRPWCGVGPGTLIADHPHHGSG